MIKMSGLSRKENLISQKVSSPPRIRLRFLVGFELGLKLNVLNLVPDRPWKLDPKLKIGPEIQMGPKTRDQTLSPLNPDPDCQTLIWSFLIKIREYTFNRKLKMILSNHDNLHVGEIK